MLDYDREAAGYDETRGGEPRAIAAADAIRRLLPIGARALLDVACGTGSVTAHLMRSGLSVYGADASPGMARFAARRLSPEYAASGRVILADCQALPCRDASLDAVTAIWLLHLLDGAGQLHRAAPPDSAAQADRMAPIDRVARMITETARVLRLGGVLITTVDKDAAHDVGSDIDALLAPYRARVPSDAAGRITDLGAAAGLTLSGETRFVGHGQGRTPALIAVDVRRGYLTSAARIKPDHVERLARALERLPDPDRRRADPIYRVICMQKNGHR